MDPFPKEFYEKMERLKHRADAIFVFVYNDYATYMNDPHLEECFDDEEVSEIIDSVGDLFREILHFRSEYDFIKWCSNNAPFNQQVYVYTMAQYINGYGRRALVPALCQLYGLININSDVYMSTIGCNKETMYKLLSVKSIADLLAPSMFFHSYSKISCDSIRRNLGNNIVLKPISESCCIDVSILLNFNEAEFYQSAKELLDKYHSFMVQKYIPGKEIGVTVITLGKNHYVLKPMEIVFSHRKEYLTNTDSYYTNYDLAPYTLPQQILHSCEEMSRVLGFDCTTRYDFRFDGEKYYLFDVSPNPTINGFTSSNYAAQSSLHCDHRGLLRLMAYNKLHLLEPSFNGTK